MGFCGDTPDKHFLAFVSPWMDDGNLFHYIQKRPETTTIQRLLLVRSKNIAASTF